MPPPTLTEEGNSKVYYREIAMNDEVGSVAVPGTAEQRAGEGPDAALDLGTLRCPMLGLKSMKALSNLEPGQTIEITTARPGAEKALRRIAWMTGATLVVTYEKDGEFEHHLRKD